MCTKQIKNFKLRHFYYTLYVQVKRININVGKSNNNNKDNKIVSIRADIMGKVEVCILSNNHRFIILVIIISTLISTMTANVHRDAFGMVKLIIDHKLTLSLTDVCYACMPLGSYSFHLLLLLLLLCVCVCECVYVCVSVRASQRARASARVCVCACVYVLLQSYNCTKLN